MNIVDAQLKYWDTSLDFNREVSCFATPQHGIISVTSDNCSGGVDFDWDKIWGFLRSQENKAKKVIMIHSHPYGCVNMSGIDWNMVQGWRLGLGVPVEFWVICQIGDSRQGVAHKYVCDRDVEKQMSIVDLELQLVRRLYPSLQIASQILYGMSKADIVSAEDIESVEKQLKESDLRFK